MEWPEKNKSSALVCGKAIPFRCIPKPGRSFAQHDISESLDLPEGLFRYGYLLWRPWRVLPRAVRTL